VIIFYNQLLLDSAILGATSAKDKISDPNLRYPYNVFIDYLWSRGGNILFSIQQEEFKWRRTGTDNNNKYKMLKGPGEVNKGSFKTS
jgi:hypothetical protein